MASDFDMDENEMRAIQADFLDFLDDVNDEGVYTNLVKDMVKKDEVRLIVNINDLRKKKPERAVALLGGAFSELLAFERALKDHVANIDATFLSKHEHVFIGLEGSFGHRHVTPRSLSSRCLGQIVCLEGIVTRVSLVRPKVVKSVHFCPTTKKFMERNYSDITSYEGMPTSSVYPTKDEEGNLLETEYGLSIYKDHQTFTIQEMPEKAPAGQLPRSVDIISDNDLVDRCKPGDRCQIVGSFRCLPGKQGVYTSGTFRCILLANNVRLLSKEVSPNISAADVKKCKRFSKTKNVFETLARSLAPSIHGHDLIKKALLCMLLGGVEKILPNGTRLRGDINCMLIGDPSTAKSQLLRYVLYSAPRAITTTGRGSSGVGLTAAVTQDPETGERRLEAGAMVLADRGVVCIDEFDKMSDIDRTAIHEVMEQGRVTITKAGINARLNARCSVLAAANPVYGRYDEHKTPMENIGMQDSLLSRFDLLFIILDKHEREPDMKIGDHVVRMHRYRNPNEQDGEPLPIMSAADFLSTKDLDDEELDDIDTPIWEKYNNLLHGNRSKAEAIVSVKFIKKYIHIAKSIKPILTDKSREMIAEAYAKIRMFEREQDDVARTQPITVRALETMIRLATAHAKGRMSRSVDVRDTEAAIELVQFAYFKKVIDKPKKNKVYESDEDDGIEDFDDEDLDQIITRENGETELTPSQKSQKKKGKQPLAEDEEDTENMDTNESDQVIPEKMADKEYAHFKKVINLEFRKNPEEQRLDIEATKKLLTAEFKKRGISNPIPQIEWALEQMTNENKVYLGEGSIWLI